MKGGGVARARSRVRLLPDGPYDCSRMLSQLLPTATQLLPTAIP